MKTRLRLLTLFIFMLATGLYSTNSMAQGWIPKGTVTVSDNSPSGTRTPPPVDVMLTVDNYLYIDVLEAMGTITLKISSSNQVMYQEVMTLIAPPPFTIYIGDYPRGEYTIEFIYPSGRTFSGKFEVD